MHNKLVVEQKAPIKNDRPAVWDMVIADVTDMAKEFSTETALIASLVINDMRARDAEGIKRYGTRLQAFNGRSATIDCLQEILDAIVYSRQEIEEGNQEMQHIYKRLIYIVLDLRRIMNASSSS